MLKNSQLSIGFILVSTLILSGCEETRRVVGLERNSPDEFTVIERAPLTLPPNFSDLPTPDLGASRPQEISSKQRAREAIIANTQSRAHAGKTPGEVALLTQAGAKKVDSNIRKTIDKEAKVASETKESFIRDLVAIKGQAPGKVIDPTEENKRLTGKETPGEE